MIKLFFDYSPLSLLAIISVGIVIGAIIMFVKLQIEFIKERKKEKRK